MTRENGAAALDVRGLHITAGRTPLVQDVSFRIESGQRVGLIGASGSGKTLTASAVAGLLPTDVRAHGTVTIGDDAANLLTLPEKDLARVRGRDVGMVFQEPMTALNPTMRIGAQVAEAISLHRSPRGRRALHAGAASLLAEVGLGEPTGFARRFPHELSGGQRQRVVLAMAIAHRPRLLICDEPTTALDVSTQAQVMELIDRRCAESGAALLFISHNLAVVTALCDYLLVMWQGRIVERGAVLDVVASPQHPHTRQLLAHVDPAAATGATDPGRGTA